MKILACIFDRRRKFKNPNHRIFTFSRFQRKIYTPGSFTLLFVRNKVCTVIFIGCNSWSPFLVEHDRKMTNTANVSVACFCLYDIFTKTRTKMTTFFPPKLISFASRPLTVLLLEMLLHVLILVLELEGLYSLPRPNLYSGETCPVPEVVP